jgi:hypothetical protein
LAFPIEDYCGILKQLREALATFGTGGGGRGSNDPVKPDEKLLIHKETRLGRSSLFLQ